MPPDLNTALCKLRRPAGAAAGRERGAAAAGRCGQSSLSLSGRGGGQGWDDRICIISASAGLTPDCRAAANDGAESGIELGKTAELGLGPEPEPGPGSPQHDGKKPNLLLEHH